MNTIKNASDLVGNKLEEYTESAMEDDVSWAIDFWNNHGEKYLKVYKDKDPLNIRDYRYEYIKKNKNKLIEKGYKVSFNYMSVFFMFTPGYIIKWK